MAKYKIASIDYEFCFVGEVIQDDYSQAEYSKMNDFIDKWTDMPSDRDDKFETNVNLKDGYDYIDNIEELVPKELTENDKKRLRKKIKESLISID
ncbi:hypothetical protein ACLOC1_08440 [Limosilactobacillus mucosae]|uniref:hypothetical protein n=1 Tax=Limosilactobacillus mucosae TaxID=97478 RepID=UPI001DDB9FFA|nr:hypothetical protein [Limosilactobacillus mucosae]MBN2900397.1 hypothetical protein [Limosilactobacillus mucosae]MDE8678073.1 hypothetical protein [Limosilactobacillus mucosae]MDO5013706.1 hypothetical protein [Lactobacillaceae bacterium]